MLYELHCDKQYSVFAKSAMNDTDCTYRGRPFGGVAFLCRNSSGLNVQYREVAVNSDRLIAIDICDVSGGCVLLTLVGVYLPYYVSGNADQTELFTDTIDKLQSLIDSCDNPVTICGDFNVQLPRDKVASRRNWWRAPPFTPHSAIVTDFASANDLTAADFLTPQSPGYTYFCHARGAYSWIDHVMVSSALHERIVSCKILQEDVLTTGDHLPLRTVIKLPLNSAKSGVLCGKSKIPRPCWKNNDNNKRYRDALEAKLLQLPLLSSHPPVLQDEKQVWMDSYVNRLCNALKEAAADAGCVAARGLIPKTYWCPEIHTLAARKKFWWRLWVENGRPRRGQVFACYKLVKKLFRKLCRYKITAARQNYLVTLNGYTRGNRGALLEEAQAFPCFSSSLLS